MAYFDVNSSVGGNSKIMMLGTEVASFDLLPKFYEFEEAVVLDVIRDENHPAIPTLPVESWPDDWKHGKVNSNDKNLSYIGRVLVRLLHSQQAVAKENLIWAKPMSRNGVVEYPLLHEIVTCVNYRNEWYYCTTINLRGMVNNNSDFNVEQTEGNTSGDRSLYENDDQNFKSIAGPISITGPYTSVKKSNITGKLGAYFTSNNRIRSLRHYEGDIAIESRHGQSIRFSAYDHNRNNDRGNYLTYTGHPILNKSNEGGGNPMLIIRNRQREFGKVDAPVVVHPLLPPIPAVSAAEKNAGGLIEEDINHDGSSIHMTSGLTETTWKSTVYKSVFSVAGEEQSKYAPRNATSFTIPKLNGDQIVINSDRIIVSSRFGETLHYSKKRYAIATDAEYTVDANSQIVMTTNNKVVFNSPAIYLGEYDQTNEPALLGQTTINWLYDLCTWLEKHTHHHKHGHRGAGQAQPDKTQIPVELANLLTLKSKLASLMSKRVFLTGGGFAPGADGVIPSNYSDVTSEPTKIDTVTGVGVPGGYFGKNKRNM
jgi:hypothetical protein